MRDNVRRNSPIHITGRSKVLAVAATLVITLFVLGVLSATVLPGRLRVGSLIGAFSGGPRAESQASTRDLTLADLASFGEFGVYSVGSQFEGLPLTKIMRQVSPPSVPKPENLVLLIYGTCAPESETGCAPPLSIRMEPVCDAPRSGYATQAFDQPHVAVRGLDAARVSGYLRLWTGGTAITVFTAGGADAEALSLRVASALRPVNARAIGEAARAAAPGDLPPQAKAC